MTEEGRGGELGSDLDLDPDPQHWLHLRIFRLFLGQCTVLLWFGAVRLDPGEMETPSNEKPMSFYSVRKKKFHLYAVWLKQLREKRG